MSAMLPKLEDIKITFAAGERSGNSVWKRWIGSKVLVSKCSCNSASVVESVGWKEDPMPAFRIKLSILVILFSERMAKRVSVTVSGEESESVKGTIMSLLFSARVRDVRPAVEVDAERIVAMTAVFGRRRRVRVRPSPMPIACEKGEKEAST
jgi:hypothetical protein